MNFYVAKLILLVYIQLQSMKLLLYVQMVVVHKIPQIKLLEIDNGLSPQEVWSLTCSQFQLQSLRSHLNVICEIHLQ